MIPIRSKRLSCLIWWTTSKTTGNGHYAISPCLRHAVATTYEKIKSQQKDVPLFVVVEEYNRLSPVKMDKGECAIADEVLVEEDEKIQMITGGRENKKFIIAQATSDGAWPEIPNNRLQVNLVLAMVRVAQQTTDPIRRHVNEECLVREDNRFVLMMRARFGGRLSVASNMDDEQIKVRVAEIREAIAAIVPDTASHHLALLVNAMYSDEHKDDTYQRLHYLRLWQSLAESRKCLGYKGNVKKDKVIVAGKKTLKELTDYRDDIAHWWTDTVDESFLANLQATINELVRHKYFHSVSR